MTSRRLLVLLLLLALVAVAGPAWAVGPLDGSYEINVTGEEVTPFKQYLVVLQNGNQFGMALLEPEFGLFYYGFGTLDDQQHVTGPILDASYPEDPVVGQFDLRFFQDGTVTGTITNLFEPPFSVSGGKFF
jgi:hypothetical protein